VDPSFDATTTAQAVGDPAGYGSSEPRGSLPHGGGAAGGQVGVLGKGTATGPGSLGTTAPGAAAARATAAGLGSSVMPGAVPATAGGRGGGDEDTEKPLADYLDGDELFKDDRPASPPVWGA
jgi:hypothetical protein